jgi:integrase
LNLSCPDFFCSLAQEVFMIARFSVTAPFVCCRKSMPKLLSPGSSTRVMHPTARAVEDLIDRLSGLAKIFAMAMYITGARPQELLNLTTYDIDDRGMVFIRGLKGSNSRTCLCPILLSLVPLDTSPGPVPLFRSYSYAKFYRSCKALLTGNGQDSNLHRPVARLFRTAFACSNHVLTQGDVAVVSKSMGHCATSSTHYYLNGRRVDYGQDTGRHTRPAKRQGR